MDIREATDAHLSWLVDVRDPSQHTVRAYTGDLRQWLEHVGGQRSIHDLPAECARSFVLSQRETGLSRRTVARPPGVGKSWFLEAFARVWETAGGVALLAAGDRGRGQSSFFPFNFALSTSTGRWQAAGPLASTAARVAELHVGTGGLVTSAVQSRSELMASSLGQSDSTALRRLVAETLGQFDCLPSQVSDRLSTDRIRPWTSE